MSRNGSGVYSLPAGSTVVDGDTAFAADLNTPLQDIAADLNIARPIVAGGTGATSAAAALINLGLTATAAEINVMDGITATTAELNVLDGIPGTLTATEIGYLDGVTSAIQTQLNAKQATITTLPLANGGTGAALMDPNADRILFWDDSAGAIGFLRPNTGLTVSGTDLDVSVTSGATLFQTITPTAVASLETNTFNANKSYIFDFQGISHSSGANRALNVEFFGDTAGAYSTAVRCSASITVALFGYGSGQLWTPRNSKKTHSFSTIMGDSATAPTSDLVLNNASGAYERGLVNYATAQTVSKIRLSWVSGNFAATGSIVIWEI
jgi:hypothetical protein